VTFKAANTRERSVLKERKQNSQSLRRAVDWQKLLEGDWNLRARGIKGLKEGNSF